MRIFFIILFIIISSSTAFAEIKEFHKQAEEPVPNNQTQEQVMQWTVQMLTREATEEAGVFISSMTELKNGQITNDEIKSVTGSLAEIIIDEKTPFVKDSKTFIKVKVRIKINIDSVQSYLENMATDKKLKDELAHVRAQNLELEKKLKNATKEEYAKTLSYETERFVAEQKKRSIELNQMAMDAKEALAKAESNQRQKELERQSRMDAMARQIEQEEIETKKRIAEEKDNIRKAELENQARIKELENNAKEHVAAWKDISDTAIEDVIKEAIIVRKEIARLTKTFEERIKKNKNYLNNSYDREIANLKAGTFIEPAPIKDQWEKTEEFDKRTEGYNARKREYLAKARNRVKQLESEKDFALLSDERDSLNTLISTLTPFFARLEEFQNMRFYSKTMSQASLASLGEVNADKEIFSMNVRWNKQDYKSSFDFSSIGFERAKAIYQTPDQFVITPKFSASQRGKGMDNITFVPQSFNVKHIGAGVDTDVEIQGVRATPFDEIKNNAALTARMKGILDKIAVYYMKSGNIAEAKKYSDSAELYFRYADINALPGDDAQRVGEYLESKGDFLGAKKYFSQSYLKGNTAVVEKLRSYEFLLKKYSDNTIRSASYVAQFSPDGKYILTGNRDGTINLWDAATGNARLNADLSRHKAVSSIMSVSFSPDSKYFVTKNGSKATIWNSANGAVVWTLSVNQGYISSSAFSPDGKYILTACSKNNLIIWSAVTGKKIRTFQEFEGGADSASFSPDGKYIVICSGDQAIKIWNVETGAEVKTLRGYHKVIKSVTFSPDGLFVMAEYAYSGVIIWNVATGEIEKELQGYDAKLSSDGKCAILSNSRVMVWDIRTGQKVWKDESVLAEGARLGGLGLVTFSPDGKYIILGSSKGSAQLVSVNSGRGVALFESDRDQRIVDMSFSPDGLFVVIQYADNAAQVRFLGR